MAIVPHRHAPLLPRRTMGPRAMAWLATPKKPLTEQWVPTDQKNLLSERKTNIYACTYCAEKEKDERPRTVFPGVGEGAYRHPRPGSGYPRRLSQRQNRTGLR